MEKCIRSGNRQKGKYGPLLQGICKGKKNSYYSRKSKVHFNAWRKVKGTFREEVAAIEDFVNISRDLR